MENNSKYIEDYLNEALEQLRLKNAEVPCRENSIAITKIEEALMWLGHRARDREAYDANAIFGSPSNPKGGEQS